MQGTARPCRLNKREPKAPDEPPRAASELSPRASFWYGVICGRIRSMGVGSSADSEMVMILAMRLAEIEECNADIAQYGNKTSKIELITVPDENGQMVTKAQRSWKHNPAVAQRSEAMRHSQSLLAEFGLSPSSRGKVSATAREGKGEQSNPWEALR